MAAPASGPSGYVGQTIDGRYQVDGLIGEGGMGFVYSARHTVIGKRVAIKILRGDMARDSEVTDRFVNEAKAATAVGSPHIVDTIDFGRLSDGSTYFVMEYLEGKTLTELIENEQPLGIQRIAQIGRQIAEALAAAHEAGIVHRDLKPDNVFLVQRGKQSDFVKILDFGIAKVASSQAKLTRAGAVFGTPHYMSPEQAKGTPVDHRTDIYALGCILYELATSEVPFDAEAPMGILSQHINDQPRPPSTIEGAPNPVPPSLDSIVLQCLEKEPDRRFPTMELLAHELEQVENGVVGAHAVALTTLKAPEGATAEPPVATGLSPSEPPQFRRGLGSKKAWLVALAAAGVGALAVGLLLGSPNSQPMPMLFSRSLSGAWNAVLAAAEQQNSEPAPIKGGKAQVALIVSPIDAHVYAGGEDLGTMPINLDVDPDQPLEVRIKRRGYWPRKLVVDGSKARVVARLAPVAGGKRAKDDDEAPAEAKQPAEAKPAPVEAKQPASPAPGEATAKPSEPAPAKEPKPAAPEAPPEAKPAPAPASEPKPSPPAAEKPPAPAPKPPEPAPAEK